jgi:predicted dehydrogenase
LATLATLLFKRISFYITLSIITTTNIEMDKIRWGILSTAKIGQEKVIPAMQAGKYSTVDAIASRNIDQAAAVAAALAIPKWYGSYEALLSDENIDAVYIPLPNHLHVPWAIKALEANKHVLCEKPIGLSTDEAKQLQQAAAQKPHLKVMEAFMYRFHPQWQQAKKLVQDGAIGILKTIHSFFSYYNNDANNIRNQEGIGGGGLMDIGCYGISLARFIFDEEPVSVTGSMEFDPVLKTDRMASGILNFSNGTASFTCSTQLFYYQRVHIFGTTGRIEIEIPFNPLPLSFTKIWLHTAKGIQEIIFDPINQYTIQGDLFSKAIIDNTPVPTSLQDAVNNMIVIEAIFKSAKEDSTVNVHKK